MSSEIVRTDAHPDVHAQRTPDKPAFVMAETGQTATYAELVARSRQVAGVLRDLGLTHGDWVAILIENHPRYLEIAWGCQRAGLRFTAISTRLTAGEVAYILNDAEASVLFTSDRLAATAVAAAAEAPSVRAILGIDGVAEGVAALVLDGQPTDPHPDDAEGVDCLYSSGTTGRPKGVVTELPLTPLGSIPTIALLAETLWKFDADTVYLSPAPLYHAAPLRFNMVTQRFGGTTVVMEHFEPLKLLELIERHRITHVQMVPTMFVRLLKLSDEERARYDLSSLQVVVHAAAPCPAEVKRAMIDWLGPIVYEYYSSTEGSIFTAITPEEALAKPGSVGRSMLGTPHILDGDGNELPAGVPGTIYSDGGIEFEYHKDPEKTAASRNAQGWSTVGDIGYLDEDGYLFLTDRKADMIIAGGVNVYPQEAENALVTHPRVADAAVFGIPDAELGERVHAVVQPLDPADGGPELEAELLTFLHERLAKFKCPRAIDFRAELPRHATGKLYKRLLRDEYAARG